MQYNAGDGTQINNIRAEPSLEDDLRTLAGLNRPEAYNLFRNRGRERQLALLAEFAEAVHLLNNEFDDRGATQCASLLDGLRAERAAQLMGELPQDRSSKIAIELARKLVNQPSIDDAQASVKRWADANPMLAAQLIYEAAQLTPEHPREPGSPAASQPDPRVGPRTAAALMPGGPEFLLVIQPRHSALLLVRLLPTPYTDSSQRPASASDIDRLLSPLVERNAEHTAQAMLELPELQVAAAYLARLPLATAYPLLMQMLIITSPDKSKRLLQLLPRSVAIALRGQITIEFPGSTALSNWPSPSWGWPWIDGALALLAHAGPAASRLTTRQSGLAASWRREKDNARQVWRAASQPTKDVSYYHRQRNNLAWLSVVLAIAIVALVMFG